MPSDPDASMPHVLVHARLVCSDESCAAERVAEGPLAEIERLACDCGGAMVVLGLLDPGYVPGLKLTIEPVVLPRARTTPLVRFPRRAADRDRRAA